MIHPKFIQKAVKTNTLLAQQSEHNLNIAIFCTKGWLIPKRLFSFFISSKKRTKHFFPSMLWQNLNFQVRFLEELKTLKFLSRLTDF